MKSEIIFGALWFRGGHQNEEDMKNQILCFSSGNRDIDKVKLKFDDTSQATWN
jgi:hypothetical protein